ncbi:MAG: alpha/beta hydrolase domain-containing protein, partial [Vicinamibacterales bacterium]
MTRTAIRTGTAACLLVAAIAGSAHAQVQTITITERAPVFNGQSFGTVGPYEQLTGIATGEIDPADPRNAVITDLDLSPRNARGMVEYRTTFTIRKPVDMSHAPGVLFYNVVNRGTPGGPGNFHVGGDPGDGFLYNLGQVLLWSGWQGDMPIAALSAGGRGRRGGAADPGGRGGRGAPAADGEIANREAIDVPIARNRDGSPVTGLVVERFINVAGGVNTQSLAGSGRTPLTLDPTKGTMISAASETQSGVKGGIKTIPSTDWAFADCATVPFPGTPDPARVCLKSGYDPALLYELTYTAKDPYVLGVGLAAMRDVISFFRYTEKDSAGTPNPLAGAIRHVIGMGNSQSGRAAKAFLNLGFNEDVQGRMVWDGLNARIAGMLGSFNTRFAQPGDIAELYMPGAEGPLWWADYEDKVRGLPAWGLLHRCTASKTCPKITETYGGPEFWYSRGSVEIAGPTGKEDLPVPENVRRYYHAGTSHGGGPGGFNLGTPSTDRNVLANNPNPEREIDRALYVALVDWVVKGTLPPPSVYPRVTDGTLVPATSAAMGWPNIPN